MAEMRLKVARGFKTGTRINTIEVPAALRVKRSSGIDWIDEALGGEGGFTPTTTMMLTGGPGTGKSTLLRQLANSITGAGHVAVYNTGEESLYQAKMACERLGLKNNFMVGEEVMLPTLLNSVDNLRNEPANKTKTMFLLPDSLQTLDDGKYVDAKGDSRGTTGKTPGYCAEMLVDWAQRTFGVVVFIGQCTKGDQFAGQNKIKHAIDIHAHMWRDMKPKSETYGMLLLEVQKNRWGCTGKKYILELAKTGVSAQDAFAKPDMPNEEEDDEEEAA
jgi:DNA repair protein RadA/Sms